MYQHNANLYFGRTANGNVRILKLPLYRIELPDVDTKYPDAILDVEIHPQDWMAIVAFMAKMGVTTAL